MKKIDDLKIIEKVKKEESNYQIKLTSQEILNSYYSLPDIKSQKEKKAKKKTIGFSILGGALLVGALATIIVIIPNENNKKPTEIEQTDFVTPNCSLTLTQELLTFASFNNSNINQNLKLFNEKHKFSRVYNRNNKDESYLTEDILKEIVQGYDEVSIGINNLFNLENNLVQKNYAEKFTYNDKEYLYRTDYLYQNNVISSLYYNDLSSFDDGDELTNYLNALYLVDNKYYSVYINQEIEKEDTNEIENEIEAIFIGENDFYKVNKENESESNKSESAFTFTQFASSHDAFNDDDDNFIYEIEYSYEIEGNDEEIELQITDKIKDKEYQYQHIKKINDNEYQFHYKYEDEYSDLEFEGYVHLIINSDNSRTYSSGNISIKIF